MINDRDLGIIGAGAFLTVLCLLFKWPFVVRVVVGLLVLVTFMIIALLRLGPDREPIEVHLTRWLNNLRSPRKFILGGGQASSKTIPPPRAQAEAPAAPVQVAAANLPPPGLQVSKPKRNTVGTSGAAISMKPVAFAWEEVGIYRLVTVLLAVVGIYFIFWLVQGGTQQIGSWMRTMFKISY
jgi:hypothetical protein